MSVAVSAALAGVAAAVLVGAPGATTARLRAVSRAQDRDRPGAGAGGAPRAAGAGARAGRSAAPWTAGAGPAGRRLDRGAAPGAPSAARRSPHEAPVSGVAARWAGRRRLAPAAVAAGVLGVGLGPLVALLAAAGSVVGWRWWSGRQDARAASAERDGAVEACGALAAELRAGRSPAEALEAAASVAAGPFRRSLQAAAATARLGGDVAGSLLAPVPGERTAVPSVVRALAACWTVCAGAGTGLATAVERLEDGLRAGRAQQQALDAELASPRATAGLLAVLPVAGLLMAAGLGADPVHVLLHTPVGLVCLVFGLALDGLGLWWTQRLVMRAARSAGGP